MEAGYLADPLVAFVGRQDGENLGPFGKMGTGWFRAPMAAVYRTDSFVARGFLSLGGTSLSCLICLKCAWQLGSVAGPL